MLKNYQIMYILYSIKFMEFLDVEQRDKHIIDFNLFCVKDFLIFSFLKLCEYLIAYFIII